MFRYPLLKKRKNNNDYSLNLSIEKFKFILSKVSFELQIKLLRICLNNFDRADLIVFLDDPIILNCLNDFFKDISIRMNSIFFNDDINLLSDHMKSNKERLLNFIEFKPNLEDSKAIKGKNTIIGIFCKHVLNGKIQIDKLSIYFNYEFEICELLAKKAKRLYFYNYLPMLNLCLDNKKLFEKIIYFKIDLNSLTFRFNLNKTADKENYSLDDFFTKFTNLIDFEFTDTIEDENVFLNICDQIGKNDNQSLDKQKLQSYLHIDLNYPIDIKPKLQLITKLRPSYNGKFKAKICAVIKLPLEKPLIGAQFYGLGCERFTSLKFIVNENHSYASNFKWDISCIRHLKNLKSIVFTSGIEINEDNAGDWSKLSHLEDIYFSTSKISFKWLKNCLPHNVKNLTFGSITNYNKLSYDIPAKLNSLSIINDTSYISFLKHFDFKNSNLRSLRIGTAKTCEINLKNLPLNLNEFLIIEPDIFINIWGNHVYKLTSNDPNIEITINVKSWERNYTLSNVKSNASLIFCHSNEKFVKAKIQVSKFDDAEFYAYN